MDARELDGYQARLNSIVDRLEQHTAYYEQHKDSRAVFTYVYALQTRFLAESLGTIGYRAPGWITTLAEEFAALYFAALDAFDQGKEVPAPWLAVFNAIRRQRSSVIEDLVFAMYTHIVHDLPIGLKEVGLIDREGASHIRDFHLVNDVLGTAIEVIEAKVFERYAPSLGPILRWLDHFGAGYDEILSDYGFRLARGIAWYNATRLIDPFSTQEALGSITRSPGIFIKNVQRPPIWSVRIVFRVSRFVVGLMRRWPRELGG